MALQKIEEVYLYISEVVDNSAENIQAAAFMDHSGIPFTRMMYNDKAQHPDALGALNSWWEGKLPPLDGFPFVTYVEVHDDIPARYSPVKYAAGIENIKNFVTTYKTVNNIT